jgi:NAD(P)-dependent dehydrogenase (short-subunit alcohol dehydrogenase family)
MGAIVVTGSASGIGAATRARLEEAGDAVIGVDLRRLPSHDRKFHFAIVHMSRGLSPSLRTTDASKPECIRQF